MGAHVAYVMERAAGGRGPGRFTQESGGLGQAPGGAGAQVRKRSGRHDDHGKARRTRREQRWRRRARTAPAGRPLDARAPGLGVFCLLRGSPTAGCVTLSHRAGHTKTTKTNARASGGGVEVVMRCSTLVIGLGSGRRRRAWRRRGDAAWLSSRAPLAALLLLAAVLQPAPGRAFPGGLDASFGTGGTVTTDFGGGETAFALVRQSDGKLVAAGERRACVGGEHDGERCAVNTDCDGNPAGVCLGDIAVARYNTDGSVDLTFGSGGRVLTDFDGDDAAFALAVQPDG